MERFQPLDTQRSLFLDKLQMKEGRWALKMVVLLKDGHGKLKVQVNARAWPKHNVVGRMGRDANRRPYESFVEGGSGSKV